MARFLRSKKKWLLGLGLAGMLTWLGLDDLAARKQLGVSRANEQKAVAWAEAMADSNAILIVESSRNHKKFLAVRKRFREFEAEAQNTVDSLKGNIASVNVKLDSANAKVTAASTELNHAYARVDALESSVNKLEETVQNLRDENSALRVSQSEKAHVLHSAKRAVSPKVGIIYGSLVADRTCEESFRKLRVFLPRVDVEDVEYIYGKRGKSLRKLAEKAGPFDPEMTYVYVNAYNAHDISHRKLRSQLSQMIKSGEFAKLSKIYGISDDAIARAEGMASTMFRLG